MRGLCVLIVAALAITACGKSHGRGRHVVYVVDVTGSVSANAMAAAVNALKHALSGLDRGDSAAVIPLTSDADTDPLGRILRFKVPARREPYDGDLRRLARDAEQQLDSLLELASQTPYPHSDLLRTMRVAAEELTARDPALRPALVLLGDFIQDDGQFNFMRDPRLARSDSARDLAATLAAGHERQFAGVEVYLGSLQSLDLRRLPNARREAIRAFWIDLLTRQGARVRWATDGPGHVATFLRERSVARQQEEHRE